MLSSKNHNLNRLQEIYKELDHLSSPSEISRRIELCREALKMISKDEKPELWGMLQDALACSLLETPVGPHAENIERAIYHFKQALEIRTCEKYPKEWAMTQNNLATAYRDRMRDDPDENIKQALFHYEQALKVRTRESDPIRWAMTQHNLAAAYYKRVRGNRAENLDQVIKILEDLLDSNIYQENPKERASIQHDLSTAYIDRIRGRRAENIEKAIRYCLQALSVFTHQTYPEHWASIQYNLGNAYRNRVHGDRLENIEKAIDHCQQALTIRTPSGFPDEWAQTQNNLGLGYLARSHGKREENIEQAIFHFQQALKVHTREAYPKEWAQAQNNLGNAYQARIRGVKAENIKKAIVNYKQALKVREKARKLFPEDWAETLNNLADIERNSSSKKDIEQAAQHLLQVLDVYTVESFPQHWARTHNNLGIIYSHRKQGTRAENIEEAVRHFQQALEVYTPQAFPDLCLYSARALGNLAFDEQRWELARDYYDTAFKAQDALMASISSANEKTELAESQNLSPRAAYAHYKSGDVKRAVEVLEKGRAQLLRESFELQRQNLERLRVPEFQHLYDNYIQARNEYKALQGTEILADWDQSLEKLQAAAAMIREEAGRSHAEYRYFLRTLSFEEIQAQAREKSLVYLIATHAGGLALVVTRQGALTIELPELEQESLQKQIWHPSNEEVEKINKHLQQGLIELEDIQAVSGGYFSMYALRRLLENISQELSVRLLDAWKETLDKTTRWLWDVVMGKLIPVLKEYSNDVTLIPAGQLALLPLHAAWTEDKNRVTGRLYALDEMNISYAPSAHALWQASLAATRPTESFMVVNNPDGSLANKDGSQSYIEIGVQAVLDMFKPSRHLHRSNATIEAVKAEMNRTQVLYFFTHGVAGWDKPEDALLKLADGDLTLSDIFEIDLHKTRLAVLSACETGVPGLELIDEMIGLPAGMLLAGVPGVVGSLWSVNAMSTVMLMARFFFLWREEKFTPQQALYQAQAWLRDETSQQKKDFFRSLVLEKNSGMSKAGATAFYKYLSSAEPSEVDYSSPYYWAAFTYTGV